jgi:hypothetical protein
VRDRIGLNASRQGLQKVQFERRIARYGIGSSREPASIAA